MSSRWNPASILERLKKCADQAQEQAKSASFESHKAVGFGVILPSREVLLSDPTQIITPECAGALQTTVREGQEYTYVSNNYTRYCEVLRLLGEMKLSCIASSNSNTDGGTTSNRVQCLPVDAWYIILSYSSDELVIVSPMISSLHVQAADELKWAILYQRYCRRTTTPCEEGLSYKALFSAVTKKSRRGVPELHEFLTALPTGSITVGDCKYTLAGTTGDPLMFRGLRVRNRFLHIHEAGQGILFITFLEMGMDGFGNMKDTGMYSKQYFSYVIS
eukprot:PhF_6_TR4319/c0_g1_i1/m.5823